MNKHEKPCYYRGWLENDLVCRHPKRPGRIKDDWECWNCKLHVDFDHKGPIKQKRVED